MIIIIIFLMKNHKHDICLGDATDSLTGWMSDVWVSYLVVLDPQVSI